VLQLLPYGWTWLDIKTPCREELTLNAVRAAHCSYAHWTNRRPENAFLRKYGSPHSLSNLRFSHTQTISFRSMSNYLSYSSRNRDSGQGFVICGPLLGGASPLRRSTFPARSLARGCGGSGRISATTANGMSAGVLQHIGRGTG